MKTRKVFLVALATLAIIAQTAAQTVNIKGGLTLADMKWVDDDDNYSSDTKMLPAWHAGVTYVYPFSDVFALEGGALLNTKGFKIHENYAEIPMTYDMRIKLLYLDVPIYARFYYDSGSSKVFAFGGPYLGIGLNGKVKTKTETSGESESYVQSLSFGADEDLRRLDYGLTAGFGIDFNVVEMSASYTWGLANLIIDPSNGEKWNNRLLQFSLAYKIDRH